MAQESDPQIHAVPGAVVRLHPPTITDVASAVDALARDHAVEARAAKDGREALGRVLVRVDAAAGAAERAELAAASTASVAQRALEAAERAERRASSAVAVAAEARSAAQAAAENSAHAQATALRVETAVRGQGSDLADVSAYVIATDAAARRRERRNAAIKGGSAVGTFLAVVWTVLQLLEAFR